MGGSIRKDMASKITHLIANTCGGDKYQYAVTFRVPVMSEMWVYAMWEKRNEKTISAASEEMVCIPAMNCMSFVHWFELNPSAEFIYSTLGFNCKIFTTCIVY